LFLKELKLLKKDKKDVVMVAMAVKNPVVRKSTNSNLKDFKKTIP
jgi:hypothetical protein